MASPLDPLVKDEESNESGISERSESVDSFPLVEKISQGTPDGDPFRIDSCAVREVGILAVGLPANAYGAAIAISVVYDYVELSDLLAFNVPILLGSLVTEICQAMSIFGVVMCISHKESTEEHVCSTGSSGVRFACNAIFLIACMNDLVETFNMHLWLHRIPSSKKSETLRFQRFTSESTTFGPMAAHKAVSGISLARRAGLYFMLLLPKVVITLMLIHYGSAYVLLSETNEDLILNCVALCFIVDIDDIIYGFTTTQEVKTCLDNMPPLGLLEEDFPVGSQSWIYANFWPLASYVVIISLMFGMYEFWC